MGTPLPQLAAHKGLRGQILLELKRAQPLTARDLAGKLRVSPNAIRHHLKELEAEQLIAYGREQRGVGAPTYADRKSTRLNSSHLVISYAVFCLKKKKNIAYPTQAALYSRLLSRCC